MKRGLQSCSTAMLLRMPLNDLEVREVMKIMKSSTKTGTYTSECGED